MRFRVADSQQWDTVLDRFGLGYRAHAAWLQAVRDQIQATFPEWNERLPVGWGPISFWDPVKGVSYITMVTQFGFTELHRRRRTIDVGGVQRLLDVRCALRRLGTLTGVVADGPPFPLANAMPHFPMGFGETGESNGTNAIRGRFRAKSLRRWWSESTRLQR